MSDTFVSAAEDAPSVARLNACYGQDAALDILETAIHRIFPRRIAAVSAFGSESALLLAMIAEVAPTLPIIFLDSGKHFPETLAYRDRLAAQLGLSNLRTVQPDARALSEEDPLGDLAARDADACCRLRKVLPLERALAGFDAWISGRKRYQGGERQGLAVFSALGARIQVNPLAHWRQDDIAAAFAARNLPPHPLTAQGYRSIGCASCTVRTAVDAASRSGRWPGSSKSECGIHWVDGRPVSRPDSVQP